MRELIKSLKHLWLNKKSRLAILSLLVSFFIFTFIFIMIMPPSLTSKQTNLTAGSIVKLIDNKLFIYNGLSFYTIDPLSRSDPEVIYTPDFRMPKVSSLLWADKNGVLLNFNGGIIYTPVYDYLLKEGRALASSNYGTWYLDFTTGKLNKVSDANFKNDIGFFNKRDQKLYFLPVTKSFNKVTPMATYSPKSGKYELASGLDLSDVTAIDQCMDRVCVSGNNYDKSGAVFNIYSLSSTSGLKKEISGRGLVQQINNNWALILQDKEVESDAEIIYQKATVYNLVSREEVNISGVFNDFELLIGSYPKGLYLLDGIKDSYTDISKNLFNQYTPRNSTINPSDKTDLSKGFSVTKESSGNLSLIISTDGKYLVVSDGAILINDFNKQRKDDVLKLIAKCTESLDTTSLYEDVEDVYIINIPDDGAINKSISEIGRCIASQPKKLLGNQFKFQAIDPKNGRVTTD